MNKKGFTLVEVISVIAILALIIIVVSTKGFGAFENSKKKIFDETMNQIKESANVLMVEVENCNDKLDEELLNSKLHILSDGTKLTCEKLKQQAESEECLTIPLKYLIEKKYITGSNASTIYETNPNMTFKGCIKNNKVNVECKENCEYTKPTTTTEANYPTVDFDYPSNKLLYISRTYPEINFTIEDLLKDLKVELNTKAYEKVQHTEIFLNEEPLCYPGNFKSFDYKSCGDYDVANMIKSLPKKETYEVNLDVRVWMQDQNEERGIKIFSDSFNLKIKEVNPVINISYPENKTIYFEEESNGLADISEIFNGLQIDIKDVELNEWIENIGIVLEGQSICDFKGEYKEGMCKPSKVDMNNVRSNAGIFEKQDEYIFNLRVYVALKKGIYTEKTFNVTLIENRKPIYFSGAEIQQKTFYENTTYTWTDIFSHIYISLDDIGSGKNKISHIVLSISNDERCWVPVSKPIGGFNITDYCRTLSLPEGQYDLGVDFYSENSNSQDGYYHKNALNVIAPPSPPNNLECISCDQGCIDDHFIDGTGNGYCCSALIGGEYYENGALYTWCPGY